MGFGRVGVLEELTRGDRIVLRQRIEGPSLEFLTARDSQRVRHDLAVQRVAKPKTGQHTRPLEHRQRPRAFGLIDHRHPIQQRQPNQASGLEHRERLEYRPNIRVLRQCAQLLLDHRLERHRQQIVRWNPPAPAPPIAPEKTASGQKPGVFEHVQRISGGAVLNPDGGFDWWISTEFGPHQHCGLLERFGFEAHRIKTCR